MRWVDIAGPPGAGKSSLAYPIWGDRSVTWDGKFPPAYWRPFLDEVTVLMGLVRDHPSIAAVLRMNDRSIKKMATVERMSDSISAAGQTSEQTFGKVETQRLTGSPVFIQTGLVQRGLGFGWRLVQLGRDLNLVRRYFWLMPVSVGAVFLELSVEEAKRRNRARLLNPETAHEDRSYQIEPMVPAIALAKEVLRERGIPIIEIDVEHQSVERARAALLGFADQKPCHAAQMGRGGEGPLLQIPPPWWRR